MGILDLLVHNWFRYRARYRQDELEEVRGNMTLHNKGEGSGSCDVVGYTTRMRAYAAVIYCPNGPERVGCMCVLYSGLFELVPWCVIVFRMEFAACK
jgi:hypothetical protein